MKPKIYQKEVRLKLDTKLRDAIELAADRDCTTMSELIRRELRRSIVPTVATLPTMPAPAAAEAA